MPAHVYSASLESGLRRHSAVARDSTNDGSLLPVFRKPLRGERIWQPVASRYGRWTQLEKANRLRDRSPACRSGHESDRRGVPLDKYCGPTGSGRRCLQLRRHRRSAADPSRTESGRHLFRATGQMPNPRQRTKWIYSIAFKKALHAIQYPFLHPRRRTRVEAEPVQRAPPPSLSRACPHSHLSFGSIWAWRVTNVSPDIADSR